MAWPAIGTCPGSSLVNPELFRVRLQLLHPRRRVPFARTATPWGKAILDFAEFRERWKTTKHPLLAIAKEKNLQRLVGEVGETPKKLATVDEYVLVTKP